MIENCKMQTKIVFYFISLTILPISCVILFWKQPILLTALLFTISVILLLLMKQKLEFYIYCIAAIIGTLAEKLSIHFGVWNYTNPNLTTIPTWLPFLWGLAALFIITMYKGLNAITEEKNK